MEPLASSVSGSWLAVTLLEKQRAGGCREVRRARLRRSAAQRQHARARGPAVPGRGDGRTRVVVATGEIDMASAPALWEALSEAIAAGQGDVIVDLSGVTFIDTQGLSVLLRAYKALSPEGRGLCLRSPCPQARKALEVSGLTRVLTLDG